MEEKHIIKSKNLNKIKSIEFLHPSIMADDAKGQIEHLYYTIKDLEKQLYTARESVRNLEKTLEDRRNDFNRLSTIFTIEFEDTEKEFITNTSSVGLAGLGNDIIGKSSMI